MIKPERNVILSPTATAIYMYMTSLIKVIESMAQSMAQNMSAIRNEQDESEALRASCLFECTVQTDKPLGRIETSAILSQASANSLPCQIDHRLPKSSHLANTGSQTVARSINDYKEYGAAERQLWKSQT